MIWFIFLTCSITSCFAQYVQPCTLDDYKCIRYILAANSDCDTRIWGSLPGEISSINKQYQLPFSNLTVQNQYYTLKNVQNCYVSAFFFNLGTNVAVLGVSCPDLEVQAKGSIVQRNPNDQNQYYSASIKTQYPLIHFTANLLHADEIDLCDTFVFSYITGLSQYSITAESPSSKEFFDNGANGATSHPLVSLREEFLTRGPPIFRLFVNYMLCDFGCSNI